MKNPRLKNIYRRLVLISFGQFKLAMAPPRSTALLVLGVASLESKLKKKAINHLHLRQDSATRSIPFSDLEDWLLSEQVKKSLKEWPYGS